MTAFVAAHPATHDRSILVLADPANKQSHVVGWWRVRRLEDFFGSEYYFVLNLDGTIEDGTEQVLYVSATPRDRATLRGKVQTPRAPGVQGATVRVVDQTGTQLGTTRSAPGGDYQLDIPFATNVTVRVRSGFVDAAPAAVVLQDVNRIEPLAVPPITVSGFSVTGTMLWPSWIEPRPATAAADRGQLAGVANHFAYTAPKAGVAEAFAPARYEYDRAYAGQPLADVRLVAIQRDPALGAQDGPAFRRALAAADTAAQVAEAVSSAATATLGRFTFDNSLVQGDYIVGARESFRLLATVAKGGSAAPANADNRFSHAAADLACFFRLEVDAAGSAKIRGQAFNDGRLYALPLVDATDRAATPTVDLLRRNVLHDDDAAFRQLLAATPVVDVGRVSSQLRTAAEQDLLLQHTVVAHAGGRVTLLYDHALSGTSPRRRSRARACRGCRSTTS